MALDGIISVLSTLDTYIYPIILLVIWNFLMTKKLKGKVFGDGADPSEEGLAITVDNLTSRVTALEYATSDRDDSDDCED